MTAMKAKCYWNLNQAKQGNYVFSVINMADGKVDHYTRSITLINCKLHVNHNARRKIADGNKKSVHAWIVGTVCDPEPVATYNPKRDEWVADATSLPSIDGLSVATYNPKRDEWFTDVSSGARLGVFYPLIVLRTENQRGVIYYG